MEDGETIIKMSNDSWVVGKKSDQREVYIIIHQKNANLIEINGKCLLTNNLMLELLHFPPTINMCSIRPSDSSLMKKLKHPGG